MFCLDPRAVLCFGAGKSRSHGGGGVSSLRVLRLLRVFRSMKLLRQVEGLNKIVNIVLKVLSSESCFQRKMPRPASL